MNELRDKLLLVGQAEGNIKRTRVKVLQAEWLSQGRMD